MPHHVVPLPPLPLVNFSVITWPGHKDLINRNIFGAGCFIDQLLNHLYQGYYMISLLSHVASRVPLQTIVVFYSIA